MRSCPRPGNGGCLFFTRSVRALAMFIQTCPVLLTALVNSPKYNNCLPINGLCNCKSFFLHLTTQHQFSSFYRYSNLQEELWRSKHAITRSCSTVLCYLISTNDAYTISASTLDSVQCFSLDWLLRNIQLHTIRSLLL